MASLLNIPFLWLLGVVNLIFSIVGIFAIGTLLGLPLFLGAAALDVPQEDMLKWLVYASPLWVPLGAGAGLGATIVLTKGIKRKEPTQAQETIPDAG